MTDEAPAVFKEVPEFDPRTLVLKLGDDLLDLQFCACANKYKKRFAAFVAEYPGIYENVKGVALTLVSNGYADLDVKDILEYLRLDAKHETRVEDYMKECPHDFELDALPRAYLIRKLMMEERRLFGKFTLAPVKCKANCGYPNEVVVKEEATSTIAGF